MPKPNFFLAAPFAALLLLTGPAGAEDTPAASTVVATVNGTDITLGHMVSTVANLPAEYRELPGDLLFRGILDQLISQTLLQQSMNGVEPYEIRIALENERRAQLAAAAIEGVLGDTLTEDQIKAAYDSEYANANDMEYSASHILVETEDAARKLIEELSGGADFAGLAKQHSTGPSGPSGGSLGWFGKGRMVAAFEAAVVALEPGEVSEPVETRFGWHVIKLHETRIAEAPPLEAVRDAIVEDLQGKLIEERIEELRGQAVIDEATIDENGESRFDPEIVKDASLLEQ